MNALIVVLLTGLVAATYGFGIYLFAQLVPLETSPMAIPR